jgi:ParB family chromosome partitioning protein
MAKPKLNLASFTGVVAAASGTAPDAEIELTLIDVVPQVRTELGDLTSLVSSIAEGGVLEPVLLLAKDDGRYRLIAGERRYRASQMAGKVKIPALIKRGLTDIQIRKIQITENNERESLSPFDESMGVAEDVEKFGFAQALIIWNRSEGWISKRMAVVGYAAPVRDLLKSKLCGDLEVLHSLNQLYAASVEEFQRFATRLERGGTLSRDEARNKVAAVKAFQQERKQLSKKRTMVSKDKVGAAPPLKEGALPSVKLQLRNADVAAMPNPRAAQEEEVRLESCKLGCAAAAQIKQYKGLIEQREGVVKGLDLELFRCFLSAVLPIIDAVGPNQAQAFAKKLQVELRANTPRQIWEDVSPQSDDIGDALAAFFAQSSGNPQLSRAKVNGTRK